MISTKLKLSFVAIVMAGLIIPLIVQRQYLAQLEADNADLRQQAADWAALQASNQRPANPSSDAEVSARSQR
jgi:hypothetical protein